MYLWVMKMARAKIAPRMDTAEEMRSRMKEAGDTSGTDKIEQHGYHRFYSLHFPLNRESHDLSILEIGLEHARSLQWWRLLYPHAHITGMDIVDPDEEPPAHNVRILRGDQSNPDDLERLKDREYDVILDDGSHVPEHQILTFEALFPKLKYGGVYVVEDIETSYWRRGTRLYGYRVSGKSALDYFAGLSHDVNAEFSGRAPSDIAGVAFYANAIIVTKIREEDKEFIGRKYRFHRFLKR